MAIAVTGGSGFIGSHVIDKLLAAGEEVYNLDIREAEPTGYVPPASYRYCDVTCLSTVLDALEGVEAVFHLAGAADVNGVYKHPGASVELNVMGTAHILEAARRRNLERVLLASSVWTYGAIDCTKDAGPGAGFRPDCCRHLYTATKISAEFLCHSYAWMFGHPQVTVMRYGIPYGPRMRPNLVAAVFIGQASRGEPLTVTGDGSQTRPFIYVEDLAEAHVLALAESCAGQVLDLVPESEVSIRELAETVCRVVESDAGIRWLPDRPGDYAGGHGDYGRLTRDKLKWAPQMDLEAGIRKTCRWMCAHGLIKEG